MYGGNRRVSVCLSYTLVRSPGLVNTGKVGVLDSAQCRGSASMPRRISPSNITTGPDVVNACSRESLMFSVAVGIAVNAALKGSGCRTAAVVALLLYCLAYRQRRVCRYGRLPAKAVFVSVRTKGSMPTKGGLNRQGTK